MRNVVAFSREGNRDIIMFEDDNQFEVQSRLRLNSELIVAFPKEEKDAYIRAEAVFSALDEALCGEAESLEG